MSSDERDQRVTTLLKMTTRDDQLNQIFSWCVDERIDPKTFKDLIRIITDEAQVLEVAKELEELVIKYTKPTPDAAQQQQAYRKLCEKLPSLALQLKSVVQA